MNNNKTQRTGSVFNDQMAMVERHDLHCWMITNWPRLKSVSMPDKVDRSKAESFSLKIILAIINDEFRATLYLITMKKFYLFVIASCVFCFCQGCGISAICETMQRGATTPSRAERGGCGGSLEDLLCPDEIKLKYD
jgi:hypothetical protein